MAFDLDSALTLANQQGQPAAPKASLQPMGGHYNPSTDPNLKRTQEAPTGLERFGRGMEDVLTGGKVLAERGISHLPGTDTEAWQDKADTAVQQNLQDEDLYEQGRGENAGVDWWRIGGNVAATLPLTVGTGGTGLLAAAGRGAATGALQGAVLGAGRGEAASGAVTGAITGGLLSAGGYGVGKAITSRLAQRAATAEAVAGGPTAVSAGEMQAWNAAKPKIEEALADVGVDPSHAPALQQQALAMLKARGSVDPKALARLSNLQDLGLEPTQAQVSRTFGDWQAERDLAEQPEGTALKDRYNFQHQKLKDLLADWKDGMGGTAGDIRDAAINAQKAITSKFDDLGNAITKAYQGIRSGGGMDIGGVVKPDSLRSAIEAERPYLDAGLAPRAQAVQSVLDKMLAGAGKPAEGEAEAEAAKGLSLNDAELLRRRIGQLLADSTDGTERRALKNMLQAHDQDVMGAMDQDAYAPARKLFKDRAQAFEAPALKATLEGDVAPDKFIQKYVLGGNVDDISAMKEALTSGTKEQIQRGTQAWQDIKGQVSDWIINKATNGHPDNPVSPAALSRALNTIGKSRLETIFDTEELAGLRRLEAAARDIIVKPTMATVNPSGTAYTAARMLRGSIGHELMKRIPGAKLASEIAESSATKQAAEEAARGGILTPADRAAQEAAQSEAAAAAGAKGARAATALAPGVTGLLSQQDE